MTRAGDRDAAPSVTHADFEEAVGRLRTGARAEAVR
jgi:hypothetical protein